MEKVVDRVVGGHVLQGLAPLLRQGMPVMNGRRGGPRQKGIDLGRLVERFGTEEKCRAYLESLRWPEGVRCPRDATEVRWLAEQAVWECRSCGYQFTVRVGTVLQDSKLPLWKWLCATFLIVESEKGMSANRLRRFTGTTYKTAWFLSQRIRTAMSRAAGFEPLAGIAEVDETFMGGKSRRRGGKARVRDGHAKTMVLGAVARGGGVRVYMDRRQPTTAALRNLFAQAVRDDASAIYTDAAPAYGDLASRSAPHEIVNHSMNEWVHGDVHGGNLEGVWSLFKRSLIGSYQHLSVKHMGSYLGEIAWRFNNRKSEFLFRDTLRALLSAETMTYKRLIRRHA